MAKKKALSKKQKLRKANARGKAKTKRASPLPKRASAKTPRPKKVAKRKSTISTSPKRARTAQKAKPRVTDTRETIASIKSRVTATRRKINRGWSEPAKLVKKSYGYTTKIGLKTSKYLENKFITLKKSETILSSKKAIKLSTSKSQKEKIKKTLLKSAQKKLKSLGKSKDNLRLIKLQYTYKVNGKKRKAYFSGMTAKLEKDSDVEQNMNELIASFESRLRNYINSGFSEISITGVRMHAYDEE